MSRVWASVGAAAVLSFATPEALGQTRTLHDPGTPSYADFGTLVRREVSRLAADHLPALAGGEPLQPAVLVSVTPQGAFVWDRLVVAFARNAYPRAALATCPKLCSVALRDAAARALAEQVALFQALSVEDDPRFLLLVDTALPYEDLLVTLASLVSATVGGPARIDLLVSGKGGLGAVPILAASPTPIRVHSSANPMALQVTLVRGGWEVRATPMYVAKPLVIAQADTVVSLVGDLKSRDPAKKVVYVGAAGNAPIRRVIETLGMVRDEFPLVVLKGAEPVTVVVSEGAR